MINTPEENNKQGKTLIVNPQLHKTLMMIKFNEEFGSIDELISDLIEKRNIYKKMEEEQKIKDKQINQDLINMKKQHKRKK